MTASVSTAEVVDQRWVGTSWKMTKTLAEARAFIDEVAAVPVPAGITAFVVPAHTALAAVRDRLPTGSPILLGAQNAHQGPEGAVTGEISMRMAADAGATLVELGHSERRAQFAETDASVAAKVVSAVEHGLIPLICVGEPGEIRRRGAAEDFVAAQVRAALTGLRADQIPTVLIAYEPIWAIGAAGRPATPAQVDPVMAAVAGAVDICSDGRGARALLYGGGVDATNAAGLLGNAHARGLFVGRAGWSATGFLALLELAARRS